MFSVSCSDPHHIHITTTLPTPIDILLATVYMYTYSDHSDYVITDIMYICNDNLHKH